MSELKRKSSLHGDDGNPRKLQRYDSQERMGIEDVSNGNIETVKHLVTRLHGKIAPDNKELWASSAKTRVLPKGQQYYDLSTVKATGPPLIMSDRPRPPFVKKERWVRQTGPGLVNALLKYNAADRFELDELNAILYMILGGQHPHIGFERSFATVFGHRLNDAFSLDIIRSICHKVRFLFLGGNRPGENVDVPATLYLMLVDIKERILYFIDPDSSCRGLSKQQRDVFLHMRCLWKRCIYPKNPDIPPPREAINLPLAQLNTNVSSGFACIVNAYLLTRQPRELWRFIKNGSTSFEVAPSYTKTLMKFLEDCLRLSVNPQWQQPSSSSNENHHLVRLPHISFDESLVALALSVKRGNWDNLTKLAHSVFGRFPRASDDFPIPSQATPHKIIPANTNRYESWTPRARHLLSGKVPPDRSDRKLWGNTIGPRIANVLLCMAKGVGLSGLDISAYLHMVLVDFIDGSRTPKVMIENYFGDFLYLPRDAKWDNLVMKNKPRFLIFRRGQGIIGHHWYVIIVDTDARQAYCFDSMAAQDTRAEHIKAFALLQERWAVRLPLIPIPEQMIELSSFSQKDHLTSGFLCLYHISLLFRSPMRLRRLKHGGVIATQRVLDHVIQAAENYIGVKVEGSAEETAPTPELTTNANSRVNNTPEKTRLKIPPETPGKIRLRISQNTPEETRLKIPQDTPGTLRLKIPQNTPEKIRLRIPQDTPKKIRLRIPQDTPKKLQLKIPQTTPEKLRLRILQDRPEKTRFQIKVRVPQGTPKVEEQQPKKRKHEESSTPLEPFQRNRSSLANPFTTGNLDDIRPSFSQAEGSRPAPTLAMPRRPKHNQHRATTAQYKVNANKSVSFSTGHQLGPRNA
ncbi:hypothetical protein F4803DRAFT_574156 [Xylaria telfairii]|nr:hypothetical protein F4803DRAFT_574156 [Xylaria telfairii]